MGFGLKLPLNVQLPKSNYGHGVSVSVGHTLSPPLVAGVRRAAARIKKRCADMVTKAHKGACCPARVLAG